MEEKQIPTKNGKIKLANYTLGEEIANAITHGVGAVFGIVALILLAIKATEPLSIVAAILYSVSMIVTYTISTVYHSLKRSKGKKVMRVLDHCFIYLLIIGTYIPFCLITLKDVGGPWILALEVAIAAVGVTFTAINIHKYGIFSMICYILMGWIIVFTGSHIMASIDAVGFWLLLSGGISYTLGAVVYGIGSKVRYVHSVWHMFVVAGTILHFLSIYLYVI